MSALFDVVASTFIGAIVLLMILGFNGTIAENAASQSIKMTAQSNLGALEDILEYDFRKIGYMVDATPADSGIIAAGRTSVTAKGDFNNDGTVDVLRWYIDTTTATGLANTNTRFLHRVVNGLDQKINLGTTAFSLSYIDKWGTPITADPVPLPSVVHGIRIALNVESNVPFRTTTGAYVKYNPGVYWERTIVPKNLR